ncbi:hypothetical protein D050_4644, partial [Vibrio parahaemolyticus VPCR-2009]
TNTA